MFLLIQNNGVAPLEAFTVLGDSGTRHRDIDGLIGQFGSGTKHAITILLRKNIEFRIYCGKNRLEFYVDSSLVTEADGFIRQSYPVKCRVTGEVNRTIDCGWTLEFGALDWRDTSMALREFVSNAIDCSKIMGTEPVVKVDHTPRAKADTTRIYVSLRDPDVSDFHRELGVHFLHFSENPELVTQNFLPKSPESIGPRIYREGVLVNTLHSNVSSAFDYNFNAKQIAIDECRNSNEYVLKARIAQLINRASKEILAQLFTALSEGDTFESGLDSFYLGYSKDAQQNWREGWEHFAGNAVIAGESIAESKIAEHVVHKGHRVVALKSRAFVETAQKMGVPDVASVLGKHGAEGQIECETTTEAYRAVDEVWGWCEAANMVSGKMKPGVKCFRQLMDGGCETLGYYTLGQNYVNLREDLAGKIALKTAIEEVAHYITGSTDCSRDFQNFAFDMIVELCV